MTSRVNPPLDTRTRQPTKRLRNTPTDAERKVWSVLRAGRLGGHKFRRQHPVAPYVVDFICLDARLIVEVDGSQHNSETDAERTRFLESVGYRVIRFWDNDVLLSIESVAEAIFNTLENQTPAASDIPLNT